MPSEIFELENDVLSLARILYDKERPYFETTGLLELDYWQVYLGNLRIQFSNETIFGEDRDIRIEDFATPKSLVMFRTPSLGKGQTDYGTYHDALSIIKRRLSDKIGKCDFENKIDPLMYKILDMISNQGHPRSPLPDILTLPSGYQISALYRFQHIGCISSDTDILTYASTVVGTGRKSMTNPEMDGTYINCIHFKNKNIDDFDDKMVQIMLEL